MADDPGLMTRAVAAGVGGARTTDRSAQWVL